MLIASPRLMSEIFVISFLIFLPLQCGSVSVRFATNDFGFVNETEGGFFPLTVEKTGETDIDFIVIIQLENATKDFLGNSWTILFQRGSSAQNKSTYIFIADDDLPEKDEKFNFNLTVNAVKYIEIEEPKTAHVTILANDDSRGVIGFETLELIKSTELPGQNTTVTFTLLRNRGSFGNVSISYQVSGQQDNLQDIYPLRGTSILEDGVSRKTFQLNIVDDEVPENDKEYIVEIVKANGGAKINMTSNVATLVIAENDSPLRFSKKVYTVEEETSILELVVFRGLDQNGESRVGPDRGTVIVDYEVISGSATAGTDYNVKSTGKLVFGNNQHRASLEIYIFNDDLPELSENFTIRLVPGSVEGDAIIAEPSECLVVIQSNDNAEGVLALDFSSAQHFENETYFVVDEDEENPSLKMSMIRRGGSFNTVSVQWMVQSNGSDQNDDLVKILRSTSGSFTFKPNQSRADVNLEIIPNSIPEETKLLAFRVLSESLQGGATLDPPLQALIVVTDSDDVYGVFSFDKNQSFIDTTNNRRALMINVIRTGGQRGEVILQYAASYHPPKTDEAFPGVLSESTGIVAFDEDQSEKSVVIPIKNNAFLETGSTFKVILQSAELINKKLLIPSHTPSIGIKSIILNVTEENANGEIGFAMNSTIDFDEPEEKSRDIILELQRQGLSGVAVVQVSYRSDSSVEEGLDYVKGPDVVTFESGQRNQTIVMQLLPDDKPELEEVLIVRLVSVEPSNQKLNRFKSEVTIRIRESDDPGGIFRFSNHSARQYVIQEETSEAVNVIVERDEGALAQRMLTYDVVPNGSRKFYGVPEVLLFPPDVRSATISLVPRDDEIPELNRTYTLVLQPYGNPKSVVSPPSTIDVTILENDDPHGLFIFGDEPDAPRYQSIGESKNNQNLTAYYRVRRTKGLFGNVSVEWKVVPNNTNDVAPTGGTLYYSENQTENVIAIQSKKDVLPESLEEFTIVLQNPTGGARIKKIENATLIIEPNDKAIFFEGSTVRRVNEGETLDLVVHRKGTGADTTTIRYRTTTNNSLPLQRRAASDVDYQNVDGAVITFRPGVLDVEIGIRVYDDSDPEDDESFIVELYDASGDYVAYGNDHVEIVISKSDNASGIFSLAPPRDVIVEEGFYHYFPVRRKLGLFGDVGLKWKVSRDESSSSGDIIRDDNEDSPEYEFFSSEGILIFEEGDSERNISLLPTSDYKPEYDEYFILNLVEITSGRGLLTSDLASRQVSIVVRENDHPYGLFEFLNSTSSLMLAEDGENSTDVTFEVERTMGTDGFVTVLWQLRPQSSTLPTSCYDLLLRGHLVGGAVSVNGRKNTERKAVKVIPGSPIHSNLYDEEKSLFKTNCSISLWLRLSNPDEKETSKNLNVQEIPLISILDLFNSTIFSITISYQRSGLQNVIFIYRTKTDDVRSALWNVNKNVSTSHWHNVVLLLKEKEILLYIDGEVQGERLLMSENIFQEKKQSYFFLIGSEIERSNFSQPFVVQGVHLYDVSLTTLQIEELYNLSKQNDISPVSGYLSYKPHQTTANASLHAVDDLSTEDDEDFLLLLLDSTGGASINRTKASLPIKVLKSDYSNGLFGFSLPCQPVVLKEGQTSICHVNRSRGLTGTVIVEWKVVLTKADDVKDFVETNGTIEFLDGQTDKTFNVTAKKEGSPEIQESHTLMLTRAMSLDGTKSSASYSGAAINSSRKSTDISIESNDHPNGILQFTSGSPPQAESKGRIPEELLPPTVYVQEEQVNVTLVVERAAGWFGHVTCEWRTRDGTAVSRQLPKDFEPAAGTLNFEDGQGYTELTVRLLDDDESELEKYFFVELSSPTGGATLNNASKIKVVIEPSDDAFGIFEFNQTTTEIKEPNSGRKRVRIPVIRKGGHLGHSSVFWKLRHNATNDVSPISGHINFTQGEVVNDMLVDVIADEIPEFNESIQIDLYQASKGSIGVHSTYELVVLSNDDPCGVITFDPLTTTVSENEGNATLTIRRTGGLVGSILVHYETMNTYPNHSTSEGIATPAMDYKQLIETVLMMENQTSANISVPIFDDDVPETNEVLFVELRSVELVSTDFKVSNSPRLGDPGKIIAEIVIEQNDSPHGILELSSATVRIGENVSESNHDERAFLYVIRKLGSFGDVTVGFNVLPGSAREQEDYNLISNKVTLLDRETKKPIPVRVIDDFTPEIEEKFTVELIPNSVTGGAEVGSENRCEVTIEESDDPYGLFSISTDTEQVHEPTNGRGIPITFTVTRRNGVRGVVQLSYEVNITSAPSSAPGGDRNSIVQPDDGNDVDVRRGFVYFLSDEVTQSFIIKVLPDDLPEDDELVVVTLEKVSSDHKGRIDSEHDQVRILIPANDRPYGDVSLGSRAITSFEKDNDTNVASVAVARSGGLFGTLRVVYTTSEIDVVSEILQNHQNLMKNYLIPKIVDSIDEATLFQSVDIVSSEDPLATCAETCLRERGCRAFLYQNSSYECRWTTHDVIRRGRITYADDEVSHSPSYLAGRFSFYQKNQTETSLLYNSQARSDSDFRPLSGASVILPPGQATTFINISILPDDVPELKEFFNVTLLRLEMIDFTPVANDAPRILPPSICRVTIEKNDYPFGLFVLTYPGSPAKNNSVVEVEEKPKLPLELVVKREGGSIGSVTVEWAVVGGTALRNSDFTGDDATLRFAHGETSKVISVTIVDDVIPEPDETFEIRLINPTGGSQLDSKHDQLTVLVLANDVVGGVIGFADDAKSVIAKEGDNVRLTLVRSEPALGRCLVTWKAESVSGHSVQKGINITRGEVEFESGKTSGHISLHINKDDEPEARERYKIVLTDVQTSGISLTGAATINGRSHEAEISIQESNDPHGVFQFAPDSQRINIKEDQNSLKIYVTRQFGSIGTVRIDYKVIPGTLSTVNPDIEVAQPGSDFTYFQDRPFIIFGDGVTSVPIVMNITNDDKPELIEIFHVNLTEALLISENNYDVKPLIPPKIDSEAALSQVVIDANDGTKGEISFNVSSRNVAATEGSTIFLNVYRSKGAYGEVSVFIYPNNEDAILGLDYECKPQTLVFPDSQRSVDYVVKILDDATPEGNESFVVLLDNPSAGLELGNATTATITIVSNDDAHGRISFDSDPVIYIDEPDTSNITSSTATLIVKRSPPDGVFGDVSVRYRVEEITSNGDVISSRRNDITPTSGFVTIENGVTEAVLKLTATMDDYPELDRMYRVTLFDPQLGATLGSNQTTCEIVIRENDAPYGYFRVFSHGVRNGSNIIRLSENVTNLTVDVVRSYGVLGYVPIIMETVPVSANPILPLELHPPTLVPFQTLPASSGVWFHVVNYQQSSYLIYLTTHHKSPLSSRIGSSGNVPSLTPGIHSTLYQWGGTYSPKQTIETDGATCATSFAIDDVMYIFITNGGSDARRETKSRLYVLTPEGNLQVIQDITTKGASYVVYFHSDHHYLVIANSVDNNQVSSIDSSVFRFNITKRSFVQVQSLPTRGASGLTVFHQSENLYLGIANRFDSEASPDAPVLSVVYKWNKETGSFVNPVTVDVSHAVDVKSHDVDKKSFLIFSTSVRSNRFTSSKKSVIIFQVLLNDVQNDITLRSHQYLNVTKPNRIELLTATVDDLKAQGRFQEDFVRNNSVNLLAIASATQSQIFVFNFESLLYVRLCEAPPALQLNPYVVQDAFASTPVVAAATSDTTAKPRASRDDDENKIILDYSEITSSAIYDLFNFHQINTNSFNTTEGDFFGVSRTLLFRPGETVQTVTINLLNDNFPEDDEDFKISLSNSLDRRAVIDDASSLDIIIEANDGAFGVIGFDQNSIFKNVEETTINNVITLNVIRRKASYGRVAVDWMAKGSVDDISPKLGQIIFEDNKSIASIQITILADDVPEVEEVVNIELENPRLLGVKSTLQPSLNKSSSTSVVRILANDSPHGVVRWAPNSLRTVVEEPGPESDGLTLVTLEMIREQGSLGDIEVLFKTEEIHNLPLALQATRDVDYRSRDSRLIMRENSTRAAVSVSILPDNIAEDIESFYVIIYNVTLIGQSSVGGEPGVGQGGSNVAEITIDENDDARGFIQFNVSRNREGAVDAFELPGVNNSLKLPLIRLVGTARSVGVEWLARPITTQNNDFFPSSGTVQFEAGSDSAEIDISIRDDDVVEFMESFTVQLVGVTGGAKLGGDLTVTVNVLPSDSPSGMFGFVQSSQTVKESSSANDPDGIVRFTVERFQGSNDEITLSWKLEESARNDLSPMSGKLLFPPEIRSRSIVLRTLPDQELEGEEIYLLTLVSVTGEAEISPVARNAEIIITADPGAAGTVSFVSTTVYMAEPEKKSNGSLALLLQRGPSVFGDVIVNWQITPADQNTFTNIQGEAIFENGENETSIVIQTVDDDIPELSENFVLRLVSATGGASLSSSHSSCRIKVVASDNPHGVFSFSQPLYHVHEGESDDSLTSLTDFVSFVSISVFRKKGTQGEVSLTLRTISGSALPNVDYYPIDERLTFNDGEAVKSVSIEIINDNLPEGPEDFCVNATDIRLLSDDGSDFTLIPTFNLSIDTPPVFANPSWTIVRIAKNDGAEGVIEFGGDRNQIKVREEAGNVTVPLVRHDGNYGDIFVVVNSLNQTARRNVDFLLPSTGVKVHFTDGQTAAHFNVTLIDDLLVENEEKFTLVLTDATDGVKIGKKKFLEIVILKSEYPNGVIRFLGQTHTTIENPTEKSGKLLRFVLERAGGNQLPVDVHWKIVRKEPFFSLNSRSTPITDDISSPVHGHFYFDADQGGQREIFVRFLPEQSDQESEEHFAIMLEDSNPAEISQEKGFVTITVLKKGHPNGIVQFGSLNDDSSSIARQVGAAFYNVIEEPEFGTVQVIFPIIRLFGSNGQLNVTWSLILENKQNFSSADDVATTKGNAIIYDSHVTSEIIITVLSDEIPELDETFVLELTSVDGGAEINKNRSTQEFVISANDYPHGIFTLKKENQRILVTPHMTRLLLVNVTRDQGLFDKVAVGFSVEYENSAEGGSLLTTNSGTLLFGERVAWNVKEIEIPVSVFLPVGVAFTVQLTSVDFIGDALTIDPIISIRFSRTFVQVDDEAGNAKVRFDRSVAGVYDVERNICLLTMVRDGLYGDIRVQWRSGYPDASLPLGVVEGSLAPPSGVVIMNHGEKTFNFTVTITPEVIEKLSFAAHLSSVVSSVGGGARINKSRDLVEIDPCGAVRFSPVFQKITVEEEVQLVNLTVERLYGCQYDIQVGYDLVPVRGFPNVDYFNSGTSFVLLKNGEKRKNITIQLVKSSSLNQKSFLVNLTSVWQREEVYKDASPRIIAGQCTSHVTILEPPDAHGVVSLRDATLYTEESGNDGSDALFVMVTVQRTVGAIGDASVTMTTIGDGDPFQQISGDGLSQSMVRKIDDRFKSDETKKAMGNRDYEIRSINVSFLEGVDFVSVPVVILNDDVSEPEEAFFVYLHSPAGGAQIDPEGNLLKIIIEANDLPNGVIGFAKQAYSIQESFTGSSNITVTRTHAFGNVTIYWRALSSLTSVKNDDVDMPVLTSFNNNRLADQLEETRGSVTCPALQLNCQIPIKVKEDKIAEFAKTFFLEIYDVSAGAALDVEHKWANVTIVDSDFPYGLFQFSPASRLPAASKSRRSIVLTIERLGGTSLDASVRYKTRQISRLVSIAGISFYPGVADVDYVNTENIVNFVKGQSEATIVIDLLPDGSSANPLPQMFQVVLVQSSGLSQLSDVYSIANVTIFQNNNFKDVWSVYEGLQQELTVDTKQNIFFNIDRIAGNDIDKNQIKIFYESLKQILQLARRERMSEKDMEQIYQVFCKLLNPSRTDAVQGYSDFMELLDQFALSLTTDTACVTDDTTTLVMSSCPHAIIQGSNWYPELINGFVFTGTNKDYFKIPTDLLDSSKYGADSPESKCFQIYFIELSSSKWFEIDGEKTPMSNKAFSVGVDKILTHFLSSPVRYRVYTNDARISPQGAECVLWNQASSRWLSASQGSCRVVDDSTNFVECECDHMSVYAARGPTDNLASYNEATYVASFITVISCFLTLISSCFCSERRRFATRLFLQMLVACGVTQIFFVTSAMTSEKASDDSCAALALIFHYFWLSQFTWMLVLALNLLQLLSFNNEKARQMFFTFILIGWGVPIVVVIIYVIVSFALGETLLNNVYGDVFDNGEMCSIVNPYGAMFSAVFPACLCVLSSATIVYHLYQKEEEWKKYDDVWFGRCNSREVLYLCWFFFLLILTWLFGGLHLAFGFLWMLILFDVFNFALGLFVLVNFCILRCPCLNASKQAYEETIDEHGNRSNGYQTASFGLVPSIAGDVINKSTQNLMKMNDGWTENDNNMLAQSIIGLAQDPIRGETSDFDELMAALAHAKNENSADPQESITHPKQIEAMNDFQELHSADCRTDEEMSDLQYSNNQITAYDFADTHL